jgi:hypothetical protein
MFWSVTDSLFQRIAMAHKLENVGGQFDLIDESLARRDEILARAGVSIPTRRDMAPFRPVRRRPRWLAFLLRLVTAG